MTDFVAMVALPMVTLLCVSLVFAWILTHDR